ncbi:MAG: GntG family PLP-dependent aldolase [Nocardioidaceae bacterium]
MIDLRSDTVTRPTDGMRAAMAAAEVGDDVYSEDPTVRRLEERVADMFGFEAALFTVTGSLANLLAVRALVGVGEEILCESSAHIARAELGAHGAVMGITMRTWTDPDGYADIDAIEALIAPDLGPFFVKTSAVSVENTHNFAGGRVQPVERLDRLRTLAHGAEVGVHLDGARVWNAHVATGVGLRELVRHGRHDGGVPVEGARGTGRLADARVGGRRGRRPRVAQTAGGGWRQAGVLAAAGIYALDHHIERLADDHAHAQLIADAAGVDPALVDTNIVVVRTDDAAELVSRCRDGGVLVSAVGPRVVRMVTHLDISTDDAEHAAAVIAEAQHRPNTR